MLKRAFAVAVLVVVCWVYQANAAAIEERVAHLSSVRLPPPRYTGDTSVEKALHDRRSVRTYKPVPLTVPQTSQILWAAQGITEPKKGARTAPSSRSRYPLEIFAVVGNVTGLSPGLYRYAPQNHELIQITHGPGREDLYKAVKQEQIRNAPLTLIITGKFVQPGPDQEYIYVEAGHVSQNVYLQAESLTLGTVAMMGFKPEEVKRATGLPIDRTPIYLMTLGKK